MDIEGEVKRYQVLEYLVGLNPFTFCERRFYTSFDGKIGFVSEEDEGGVRMILSNGEEYDFQKLQRSAYTCSSPEEKMKWKLRASYTLSLVRHGERIIKQLSE